ncbi:MAG: COX15/CtaA family protein, partial [Clostridia bacterium]|nr:COX15/CtaA family protein [Deltaproteobacteria bacterium]
VALAVRLTRKDEAQSAPIAAKRTWLGVTVGMLFMQIVVGALVKHTGASLACGVDVIACDGGSPLGGPAHLHFGHRVMAVIVLALVIASTIPIIKAAKAVNAKRLKFFAVTAHVIVLAQIALGVVTVLTYIAVPATALHLGIGAALLADLVALYVSIADHPGELIRAEATSHSRSQLGAMPEAIFGEAHVTLR